ncbi:LLM class flavin-dependent oxidoreductase [Pseudactinotalea sp.]|uniref:LLM class flavin-dependent oxidoreductase n=1 Tax=Pseudactinotalea sp. TaxID=1926260 RepID=UPI003B3AE577
MVHIIGIDLIAHGDQSGERATVTDRYLEVVENAKRFEALGFDGFGVGERHHAPFLSSSPPVLLSRLTAETSRIRLFTGVTLLSVLDPVRAAEDYATLDHLSNGRLELIVGKGNGPEQAELFGVGRLEAWDALEVNYRLLRQLWGDEPVTWTAPEGVPLTRWAALSDVRVFPQPRQPRIRVWHGSATAERSVELAVEFGDPIFSANGFNPIEHYAKLIRHYRRTWEEAGRDPADALVGAGHGGPFVARRSQDAVEHFRPIYERFAARIQANDTHLPGTRTDYESYEDFLERGSWLIGSPQQVIDKVLRYHEEFGHTVISTGGHRGDLSQEDYVDSLTLFAQEVVPELRRVIPDPPPPPTNAP